MTSTFLWVAMAVYGLVMLFLSPRAKDAGAFFSGRDDSGKPVGLGLLVGSIVISWLFAKSITNASNLGAKYGLVGSVAYAGWYFSIPVAGAGIYWLRKKTGARSLGDFITSKYGKLATAAFSLVIMFRLWNEVWSNSAVVGAYFGESQTAGYYAGALAFSAFTLAYSLRGGLRSSILTDAVQLLLALFLLVFVLALVVPGSGIGSIVSSGEWTLAGGVDLLLVGMLQSLSYGFHDPVLTDRGFITDAKDVLRGYLLAGLIAGGFIVVFGFVGIHGKLAGLDVGQDSPLRVAESFGVATLVVMSVIMMVSAGSTLDSTLSSVAKAFVVDLGGVHEDGETRPVVQSLTTWLQGVDHVKVGRIAMVLTVIVGTLPLFAGAEILKATTISGTMVLGLAPIFLLFAWRAAGPVAFHMALWSGVAVGIAVAAKAWPESLAIGDGPYAGLLGANVYGTIGVFVCFGIGALVDKFTSGARSAAVVAVTLVTAVSGSSFAQSAPPQEVEEPAMEPERKPFTLSGQTMLRLTTKFADPTRPSAEIYNVRLVGQAAFGDFSFLVEPRFRQSNLRSFSPSNVWLQQGFAKWATPVEGLSVSGGLIYNQLGLFWDGSWFGNLPYLNGHKLDPDMNLEVAYTSDWDIIGLSAWLQASPGEDGLNGTYYTGAKADLLEMAPDPETLAHHREALSARARVVPRITLGPVKIEPGGSLQYSVIDRSEYNIPEPLSTVPEATGEQLVIGGELTVSFWRARVFGELLTESVTGFETDVDRDYILAGAGVDIIKRDTIWVPRLSLNASVQTATYSEGVDEMFLTSQVHLRLNEFIGFTTEYVNWQVDGLDDPVVNRLEWILHIYY